MPASPLRQRAVPVGLRDGTGTGAAVGDGGLAAPA